MNKKALGLAASALIAALIIATGIGTYSIAKTLQETKNIQGGTYIETEIEGQTYYVLVGDEDAIGTLTKKTGQIEIADKVEDNTVGFGDPEEKEDADVLEIE